MDKTAKFNIGDCVVHKRMRYRAIIIDIDPLFQASGHYNPRANKHEFASRNPWYRLLVDESSQMTYVEECLLIRDQSTHPIDNPHVPHYLRGKEGQYHTTHACH